VLIIETAIILKGYHLSCHTANIWNLLGRVQSLKLTAETKEPRSFFHNATASGSVRVSKADGRILTFHESGVWTSIDHQTVDFRNIYRWSLSDSEDTIRLTHLRYGDDYPVHLVDFIFSDENFMQSFQPHVCGADRYSASLSAVENRIFLRWVIQGPEKDEILNCEYLTDKTALENLYDH